MDTACLRIKFTPLLQRNPKYNSKCCLEIVPEVSCLQNLDKLTWKQETNFIEYTIPMTYKVILKKRQAIKELSERNIKTYHSCVDLLYTSSKSTANLGSGDISKIVSDTIIISKNVAESTSAEIIPESSIKEHKDSNVKYDYRVSNKTTKTSFTESKETNVNNIKDRKVIINTGQIDNGEIETDVLDKSSLDKLTSTDALLRAALFNESIQCGSSIIHVVPEDIIRPESKRLTLSPICSISTQDRLLKNKIVDSKAITCKIYDSQKDLARIGSVSTPSDIVSNENQTQDESSFIVDLSGRSDQRPFKPLRPSYRIPPELRIARYLEYMEKEILPLKRMHNEILCKCASFGITLSKKSSKQSVMYKSRSAYSCPKSMSAYSCSNIMRSEESKSNRVVYSIVFDG